VLVGVRDIDAIEKENVPPRGYRRFHHARYRRARHAYRDGRSVAHGRTRHRRLSYSLDMDWIDPKMRRAWALLCAAGATYREAHLAMEIIADHGRMLSFEIVEVKSGNRRAQPNWPIWRWSWRCRRLGRRYCRNRNRVLAMKLAFPLCAAGCCLAAVLTVRLPAKRPCAKSAGLPPEK